MLSGRLDRVLAEARRRLSAGAAVPGPFPWAKPRRELLLLVLVAGAALLPVLPVNTQDQSRLCLSEALLRGQVSYDPCFTDSFDHAIYQGHLYSDKAPGLSLLAVPAVEVLQPGSPDGWPHDDLRIWAIRVLSVGVAFVLCAFLVGRVSEGLAPGYGSPALVTFALGTLLAPLSASGFEHVPAAALALSTFLLAWSRRPLLAGLVAGAAVLVEYETGLIVALVGCYLALTGWPALRRYLLGIAPAAVLLGAYDWAAFGAPWHLSYSYVGGMFADEQGSGLFGIGAPNTFAIVEVFAGTGGLLVVSPVLALATVGLGRWGASRRVEAVVAAVAAAIFVYVNCSYFLPYGGGSPGPRFLVAGLPFLALGLGPAFAAWPRLTLTLAALSVVPMVALSLMWGKGGPGSGGVWGELGRALAQGGTSQFVKQLPASALSELGAGPLVGALVVGLCALAAFMAAATAMPWVRIRARRVRSPGHGRPSRRVVLAAGAGVYLIVAANTMALTNSPYGVDPQPKLTNLDTTIVADHPTSYSGGEVNFTVTVTNVGRGGAGQLFLRLTLSPGLALAGRPAVTLGPGCTGERHIVCNLGYLTRSGPEQTAKVYLGAQVTQPVDQQLTAQPTSYGQAQTPANYHISVGS